MTDLSKLLIVTPHASGALPPDVLRAMLGEDAFDTGSARPCCGAFFWKAIRTPI